MIHPELWDKIKHIEFDSLAVGKTFSKHLADENSWSLSFAQRAVREYKKFMYLYAVSEHPLVPSDVVEQVWRLHLSDTRHYWGTFCKIIGRPLHHQPVGEVTADTEKNIKNYQYTKNFYKEEFQRYPKADFWPDPGKEGGLKSDMQRVDRSKFFLLRKPPGTLWRSAGRFAGIATFPLSIVVYALNQSTGMAAGEISALGWLMVAGVAIVIAIFGCLVWKMESSAKTRQAEIDASDDLDDVKPRFA